MGDVSCNGKYSNGKRCSNSNSTLNRCGTFQGGGSANSEIRRSGSFSDVPPINEFMSFEPIPIENCQCNHLSDALQALGRTVDGFCELIPSKIEGLKASVQDCSNRASRRTAVIDSTIAAMTTYIDKLKKCRSGKCGESSNLKMGNHCPSNHDIRSQKSKERTKNTNLNKRARSSKAEIRGKGIIIDNEKVDDMKKGELLEKKMRRKRSFGTAFNCPSPDAHNFRSSINEESLPKAKASRTSRAASVTAKAASVTANAASSSCENSERFSQNNRKRSTPLDSSQRIVKWGDHRSNKISRTRRSSVVSPMSIESADVTTSGAGHHLKGKPVVSSTPTSVSGNEDLSVDVVEPKKSKPVGIRRQGRSARSAASPKTSLLPETKPKKAVSKPTKGSITSQAKGKPGRPPKKILDKKNAASPGHALMSPHINSPLESEDDLEELLAATAAATVHQNSIGTGTFWKQCNDVVRPISSEDLSFIKQQLYSEEEQQVHEPCTSKILPPVMDPSKEQVKYHHNEGSDKSSHLYQRVLSALIIEDDYKDVENIQALPINSPFVIDGIDISIDTIDNEALMKELEILGVAPEPVPDLDDKESDSLGREIAGLTKNVNQLKEKKKTRFHPLYKAAEEDSKLEMGRVENRAVDNLVEIAYTKLLAPKTTKSSKRATQSFIKRTNLRCQKFEQTGDSSFLKPAFLHSQDVASTSKSSQEGEKGLEVDVNFVTAKRTGRGKTKKAVAKPTRKSKSKSKDKPQSLSPETTHKSNEDKDVANMSDLQALDIELPAANQDLGSWLDVEGLHDADGDLSLNGLDIPMDDLADLGMF